MKFLLSFAIFIGAALSSRSFAEKIASSCYKKDPISEAAPSAPAELTITAAPENKCEPTSKNVDALRSVASNPSVSSDVCNFSDATMKKIAMPL